MDLWKILWYSFCIGAIMFILQVINISGALDAKEFVFLDSEGIAPLNIEPLNTTLQLFLKNSEIIYNFFISFDPTKSSLYVGIEWLTGTTQQSFLNFLLYISTFLYFFILTFVFGKVTTIFHSAKEQWIFFIFTYIIYFIVIKVLWSI